MLLSIQAVVFFIVVFVFILFNSFSMLSGQAGQYVNYPGAEYVEEEAPIEDLGNVEKLFARQKARPLDPRSKHLGLTNRAFWVRWKLDLTRPDTPPLFYFLVSSITDARLYLRDSKNQIFSSKTGVRWPSLERGAMPYFELPTGRDRYDAYLRIESPFELLLTAKLGTRADHFYDSLQPLLLCCFYLGVAILTIRYHGFWYLTFRNPIYLSYIALILTLSLVFFVTSSMANFIFPEWGKNLNAVIHIIIALPAIAANYFGY